MANYNVNASVPKTLVRHLIRWTAASGQVDGGAARVLEAIVATPISPELVPGPGRGGASQGAPAQRTEAVIGPFDLQDFNLYWISRFGFRPSRVAFLALHAWGDRAKGAWPPLVPEAERHQYDLATIKRWLEVFLRRFFGESQFKRSAMPNAPKVGSGGSLSPRGDWRAPSDASAEAWLAELRAGVP
jgi:NAD+ synthase (glutamine-hydrolysing)